MFNSLNKAIKFVTFIKNNFMWLLALIFGVIKFITPFINQRQKTKEINSKPEDRKEAIGVADGNGFKQVQATASNSPKSNEIPVGTIPETKTTISGEATLKPISGLDEPGERPTEDVMEDLRKALNR